MFKQEIVFGVKCNFLFNFDSFKFFKIFFSKNISVSNKFRNSIHIMSYSTYAPTFKVPEGFPELLSELTTEILRNPPEDATGIYKFSYDFFLKKQQTSAEDQQEGHDEEEAAAGQQ